MVTPGFGETVPLTGEVERVVVGVSRVTLRLREEIGVSPLRLTPRTRRPVRGGVLEIIAETVRESAERQEGPSKKCPLVSRKTSTLFQE